MYAPEIRLTQQHNPQYALNSKFWELLSLQHVGDASQNAHSYMNIGVMLLQQLHKQKLYLQFIC